MRPFFSPNEDDDSEREDDVSSEMNMRIRELMPPLPKAFSRLPGRTPGWMRVVAAFARGELGVEDMQAEAEDDAGGGDELGAKGEGGDDGEGDDRGVATTTRTTTTEHLPMSLKKAMKYSYAARLQEMRGDGEQSGELVVTNFIVRTEQMGQGSV